MDSNSQSPTGGDPFIVPFSVRGSVDEKSLMPRGPSPHVIQEISDVKIQRLQKKIRKLTKARDYWKDEYKKLEFILKIFPYSKAKNVYEERQAVANDLKRLRELEISLPLILNENERLRAQIGKIP